MRNLLLLLVLANVLYFFWGLYADAPEEQGVVVVRENQLGPPLKLANTPRGDATADGTAGTSDLAANVGRSCVSIGPFTSSAEANGALAEYRGEGMRASVRTTEGQVFVGHWVQIQNIPNRATGNQMLETLKQGGLGDAYLVPTEDDGLKISLGLFGEMSRAERVELQARSLDLDADISPRMRDSTVFFVDLALPPGRGASSIMERFGEENVNLRELATCPRPD